MSIVGEYYPELAAGDCLSRDEFLRRWEDLPNVKLAELIGGVVYMPPPVSVEHGRSDSRIATWLQNYAARTPGCDVGSNSTWLMLDDAPQPDSFLRIESECGGHSWIEAGYLRGAPELAAEISYSSTALDLHQKLELYAAAGIDEYVTVLLRERELRWHRLVGSRYQTVPLAPDGIARSALFAGLWLDVPAFLKGDMAQVLEVLQSGLSSTEHAAFAARLRQSREAQSDPGRNDS